MSKSAMLGVALVWVFILGAVAVSYKLFFLPKQQAEQQQAKVEEKKQVLQKTSTQTHYKDTVDFAIDNFSGYSILRSDAFRQYLASKSVMLNLTDDSADYTARLKNLQNGNISMAVFTLDALIKASAELGDMPATVVAIIDESNGADAIVSGKSFQNIDALNNADTKFVVTPNSPSETLSRVVMANFNLTNLSDPFIKLNGAKEVYAEYLASKPTDKKVFVLWEPYVSKILENPEYKSLIDSSKFRGYIVDVIVVNRDFLVKNENVVKTFIEGYFDTNYSFKSKMDELTFADAKANGEPLKLEMAKKLTTKIRWKNTQENYAHFGFTSGHGYQHIEDMLVNITKVLVKTGAIKADPTAGQPNLLYYDKILRAMFDNNFHPGNTDEDVAAEKTLVALTDEEWNALLPVGTLQVPRLVFPRGTATLTSQSEETLTSLVADLKTFPQYYLIVRGHCSKVGDLEANKILAQERAAATMEWLVKNGVDKNRIKADTSEPNGSTTVAFILGQQSY